VNELPDDVDFRDLTFGLSLASARARIARASAANIFDVLVCPVCNGRMKLLAMVTDGKSIRRFLASTDEALDAATRSAKSPVRIVIVGPFSRFGVARSEG